MSMKYVFVALVTLCSGFCYGQTTYTVPLGKLNPSLAVPAMTTRDGVVYVAYRSFDWLRQSDQLQVLAYDLNSHKVLKHGTISVPKVHGSRASNGLALSHDGAMLAYVEVHEPSLVLLISAKDLSEVRRSSSLPFTTQDYRRQFAGFDGENHLSFSSINRDKPRFVHVSTTHFKTVSDTRASAITKTVFGYVTWNPVAGRFWLPAGGGNVLQFNEEGQPTGEELKTDVHQLDQGAIALGQSGVMAFYAMVSRGAVASYTNHKSQVLELPCSPRPYGASNDHAYAGAICITQPDRLPEAGGLRVLTSDFLLIRVDGPQVVWRQAMSALGAGDNDHFEWASAVIERGDKYIRVVVPTKSPELAVYEVALPNNSSAASASK
jgi:hypothetical protein